ncbi:MAG: hypothetical protein AAGG01_15430 [Planctomycetota bacterium]
MIRWLAPLWLVLGGLVSPWGVTAWSGSAPLERAFAPLLAASCVLIGFAAFAWFRPLHRLALPLTLLALSSLTLGPLALELGLRVSFRVPSSPTRAPIRFGHNLIDEDFWILAGRWQTYADKIVRRRVQPDLGWCQTYPTPENPLRLAPRAIEQLSTDDRPKILFYGDSYVSGHSRPENHLPTYLDDRLPETDVVHLGVGGYGTGQALRLSEETSQLVDRPLVIMSAMVYDLDRSTLRVRSYQKPVLRVTGDGGLEITNTPVHPDPDQFFDEAALSFRSYALRGLRQWALPLKDERFHDKLELNRAILSAVKARADREDSDLLYVLFHPIQELLEPDYRSTFFLEALAEVGIEVFDTRVPLTEYLQDSGASPGDLYVTGHHNDLGNEVIGAALLEELRRRGAR